MAFSIIMIMLVMFFFVHGLLNILKMTISTIIEVNFFLLRMQTSPRKKYIKTQDNKNCLDGLMASIISYLPFQLLQFLLLQCGHIL